MWYDAQNDILEREPEPYCVLCETEGHTVRSCPTRDDTYDQEMDDYEDDAYYDQDVETLQEREERIEMERGYDFD